MNMVKKNRSHKGAKIMCFLPLDLGYGQKLQKKLPKIGLSAFVSFRHISEIFLVVKLRTAYPRKYSQKDYSTK